MPGNPQKVQRYAAEWARARCAFMAGRDAELLIPGPRRAPSWGAAPRAPDARGQPRSGWRRFERENGDAHEMPGSPLDQILAEVRPPAHLAHRPVPPGGVRRARVRRPQHLAALRRAGGMASPAHLKPARARRRIGPRGPPPSRAEADAPLSARAGLALCRARPPRSRLSSLVDWAAAAEPDNARVHAGGARRSTRARARDFRRGSWTRWYLRFPRPANPAAKAICSPSRRARFPPGSRRTTAMTGSATPPHRPPRWALCAPRGPWWLSSHSTPSPWPPRTSASSRRHARTRNGEQAIAAKRLDAFSQRRAGGRFAARPSWNGARVLYAVAASPNAEQHGVRRGDRIKVHRRGERGPPSTTSGASSRACPRASPRSTIVVGRASRMAEAREPRGAAQRAVPERSRALGSQEGRPRGHDGRPLERLAPLAMQERDPGLGHWSLSGDTRESVGLCAYYDARLKGRPIGPDDGANLSTNLAACPNRRGALRSGRPRPGARRRAVKRQCPPAPWNARNLAEDLEAQLKETALRRPFTTPADDSGHVQGAGVLGAAPTGTILTAAHLRVAGQAHRGSLPRAKGDGGRRTEALARNLDLAVIKTDLGSTALPLARLVTRDPDRRAPLHPSAFPVSAALGSAPQAHRGHGERAVGPRRRGRRISRSPSPCRPDSPRDPLVNAQGQLVGLLSTSIDDLPFPAATGSSSPEHQLRGESGLTPRPPLRAACPTPPPRPVAWKRMSGARSATCRIEVDR